jgi:micrococcal nuclease
MSKSTKSKASAEPTITEMVPTIMEINNIPAGNPNFESAIPFVPPITNGYVIKVYDGDTITIAAKLPYDGSPLYKFSVRLNGIDTPEIKTKNPLEKQKALECKGELTRLCLNKTVELQNVTTEKYGRILADVYCDGTHLNQHMITGGFAVPYDGGHKKAFEENFS